jgi:2-succinyl-5-enolpyruvyl-6-hydroxy-3-cyclohexene-1-carboxylate synthase
LKLTKFLRGQGPLLVLVGSLETTEEMKAAEGFLSRLGAPVYAEGTSGLRESRALDSVLLKSGDKILPLALKKGWVRRVLRIGGVPTARIWRDLEDANSPAEVFSLSPLPFAGLSRGEFVCAEIAPTLSTATTSGATSSSGEALLEGDRIFEKEFLVRDRELREKLEALLDAEPMSEPSLVRSLSRVFGAKDLFYVGNSLPVREWDLAADRSIPRHAEANRGVNGIDGQISTFLGLVENGSTGWALIGDLTAMYDLAGPWAAVESARNGASIKFRLVVLNNSGGKIFHRIFRRQIFENQHDFDFQKWAEQWRLPYEKWTSVPESWTSNSDQVVIELVPDNSATERFYDRYDALFV